MISISGSSGTIVHVSLPAMDPWIREAAAEIAKRAPRELEALVAVSSPSGDVHGANECASVCAALLPGEATIERVAVLLARPRRGPRRPPARDRHAARRCWSATSTPSSPTPSTSALQRVGEQLLGSRQRRHEGRRRPRDRRAARVRQAPRALRAARAPAGVRRGVADRGLRPRRALRGLRRLPVLRGGGAQGRRRGRRRAAQGRRARSTSPPRPQRPQRLGAGPRAQRAARARPGRAARRRASTTRRAPPT